MRDDAAEPRDVAAPPHCRLINPFGAHPELASELNGLGGSKPASGPGYVFKTKMVRAGVGLCRFVIRFEKLTATYGTLFIELSNQSRFPGAPATRQRLTAIAFADIVAAGGIVQIEAVADRNVRLALGGHAADETDAAADGLVIELKSSRPLRNDTSAVRCVDVPVLPAAPNARSPLVGAQRLRRDDEVSFALPSSQLFSPRQVADPAYAARMAELGRAVGDAAGWPEAFVLQVAATYGVVRRRRRAIGFAAADSALPVALAAQGWKVLATERGDDASVECDLGAARRRLRRPALCADAVFDAAVDFSLLPFGVLPQPLHSHFDLAWWIIDNAADTDLGAVTRMLCSGLAAQGMAVLVLPFDPAKSGDTARIPASRQSLERLALDLISHGVDVGQLCTGSDKGRRPGRVVPFGLIARRP